MPATFVTDTSGLGSAQNPTFAITVSGTNPALVVDVGLDSTTATISSVSWSLGSGTPGEVANIRSGTAFSSTSKVPAPAAGAGTLTVNKSAAGINHQVDVQCWSSTNQADPCPNADAQTSTSNLGITQTPTNLTANDATNGNGVSTVAGNPLGVSPNSRYLNTTTSVNMEAGDNSGTSGVTYTDLSGSGASAARVAVRIVFSAAVASLAPSVSLTRGGRGPTAGPAMRRMMPQQYAVEPPLATETSQVAGVRLRGNALGLGPTRRRFQLSFPPIGSPSVTLALSGVSTTTSAGTVGVLHTNALTGVSETSSVGAVNVGLSKALSGVSSTTGVGSIKVQHANALAGVSSVTGTGTAKASTAVVLAGVQASGSAGTVTPTTGTVIALTGVEALAGVGTLTAAVTNEQVGPVSKFRYIIRSKGRRHKSSHREMDELLERIFNPEPTFELTPTVVEQAREIVQPFVYKDELNLMKLEKDLRATRSLLNLWQAESARLRDEDDDDMLLMS